VSATVKAHEFEAMGTTCALFAIGQPSERLRECEGWVHRLGARLTRFSSDSELSRLNASRGRWVETSPEMSAILRESLGAYEKSAGLVNVAVLPSMLAVGYTRPFVQGATMATLEVVEPAPALPDVLELGEGRARLAPGAGIDLGGVAKGWMSDRIAGMLGPTRSRTWGAT
jgi:thiamine biosynthesis lipoprotein